jgi:uracil-DNA glycosylase
LLAGVPNIQLTLVIGQFAQGWHLPDLAHLSLTERVRAAKPDAPTIPLPHPSPRNGMWLKQNPWFERDILPNLKSRVKAALQ